MLLVGGKVVDGRMERDGVMAYRWLGLGEWLITKPFLCPLGFREGDATRSPRPPFRMRVRIYKDILKDDG